MRAFLSLSVVCLLTAAWTLVVLWMTGVLPAQEVRADFAQPAAQPVAQPVALPATLPAEKPPTAEPGTVRVVEVTRGGRDAALGGKAKSAGVAAPPEGPRLLESVPATQSGEASPRPNP